MTICASRSPLRARDDFGGFTLGHIIDRIDNPVIRTSPFGMDLLRLFLSTFAVSAGRQYVQVGDMYVLVAIIQQWEREGRVAVDWEIVLAPHVSYEVGTWPLPDGHTGAPDRTARLVGGTYQFWWQALVDVFRHRYFGFPPAPASELDARMGRCGVPLYTTSASTWEELAGIHQAFTAYRDPRMATAPPADLVRLSVHPHLAGELHWQTERRPRRRTPGTLRPDVHELGLRTLILSAADIPPARRSPYDEYLLLLRNALDHLVTHPRSNPFLADIYRRLLVAYNVNHPDAPLAVLHR